VETEQIKTHRCIQCKQKTNRLVCSIITIDIEFQPLSLRTYLKLHYTPQAVNREFSIGTFLTRKASRSCLKPHGLLFDHWREQNNNKY